MLAFQFRNVYLGSNDNTQYKNEMKIQNHKFVYSRS